MKPLVRWLIAAALLIALVFAALALRDRLRQAYDPDPETIAAASLQALREQNRLSAFAARFVAVVTSSQERFGLTARKTLIMPGNVRYEVDLAKLGEDDVRWDAATNTLSVALPPIEISTPEVALSEIREYDNGGLLLNLSDAETRLDEANRRAGQVELVKQARAPATMRLARDATIRAVERNFALPLRAAGVEATVEVSFADEGRRSPDRVDRSRRLDEVLGNATR